MTNLKQELHTCGACNKSVDFVRSAYDQYNTFLEVCTSCAPFQPEDNSCVTCHQFKLGTSPCTLCYGYVNTLPEKKAVAVNNFYSVQTLHVPIFSVPTCKCGDKKIILQHAEGMAWACVNESEGCGLVALPSETERMILFFQRYHNRKEEECPACNNTHFEGEETEYMDLLCANHLYEGWGEYLK